MSGAWRFEPALEDELVFAARAVHNDPDALADPRALALQREPFLQRA